MSEKLHLYEQLTQYTATDAYPLHMPGHKRRSPEELTGQKKVVGRTELPYDIDITEIDGFDNLHHAEGILLDAKKRLAALYESEESFYLINGSTGGILSAVSACTTMHGKILMARNCHKAAYHAAQVRGLETVYLYPQLVESAGVIVNGPVLAADVEEALERDSQIQAVLITTPSYDGMVSDVRAIAEAAHRHGVPLIVDEAHGAHFGFHPYFPENSVKLGADIVIHSLHKTLPAMTQTAALHVNGTFVDRDKLREYLGIYQTSSPSYVLMAGIDRCVQVMTEYGRVLMEAFASRLEKFRNSVSEFQYVRVLKFPGMYVDASKILMAVPGKSGTWLAKRLREESHLEVEMETAEYALALTSVADTDEGFERLRKALQQIDEECVKEVGMMRMRVEKEQIQLKSVAKPFRQKMSIAEAKEAKGMSIALQDSAGYVSKEYVYLYPPGIPLVVPGEEISAELMENLLEYREQGMSLQGLKDYRAQWIEVCVDVHSSTSKENVVNSPHHINRIF